MKVLLINTSEKSGGAAVACNRLMKALSKEGVAVKMLVRDKQTSDENVISVNSSWCKRKINKFRFLWERLVIWMHNGFRCKNLFAVSIANSGTDISKSPEVQEADIIHLHWINQGLLSLADIEKLIELGKPIVWTMHDMWPCTAICHHARECTHYLQKCENCFYLKHPSRKDISAQIWKKKLFLNNSSIKLIAVSQWLKDRVQSSPLVNKLETYVIPNVLDLQMFYPHNRQSARRKLNIADEKKVLIFGAAKVNDSIKGFDILKKAISDLSNEPSLKKDLLLIIFGNIKGDINGVLSDIPCDFLYQGVINDMEKLAELYSIADVTIVPSHYETFGQTIIESMACGTPVVSFNNSGQTGIITHLQDGYLANYKDSNDLMNGIHWILFNADYPTLSLNARNKVIEKYAEKVVAEQYIKLYNKLLES